MKEKPIEKPAAKKRADLYDEGTYNYLKYWEGREYENAAEEIAIRRLLKGKKFKKAVDVGGGFGRLAVLLEEFAEHVTLAEPSKQQLRLAKEYLKDHPKIEQKQLAADDLKFKDGEVDLVTMIRVMHHLPNPEAELAEIARVLAKGGYAIVEVANYMHARNRVKHLLRGKKMPVKPVDIRSEANRRENEVAFVNHNPYTVIKQLAHAGLKVERTLSVSNLRSPGLKKIVPHKTMLAVENILQAPLASTYFGPSIFFLVKKG